MRRSEESRSFGTLQAYVPCTAWSRTAQNPTWRVEHHRLLKWQHHRVHLSSLPRCSDFRCCRRRGRWILLPRCAATRGHHLDLVHARPQRRRLPPTVHVHVRPSRRRRVFHTHRDSHTRGCARCALTHGHTQSGRPQTVESLLRPSYLSALRMPGAAGASCRARASPSRQRGTSAALQRALGEADARSLQERRAGVLTSSLCSRMMSGMRYRIGRQLSGHNQLPRTPALKSLAREAGSVLLDNFYVQPLLCFAISPAHWQDAHPNRHAGRMYCSTASQRGCRSMRVTLAERLHDAGYATHSGG